MKRSMHVCIGLVALGCVQLVGARLEASPLWGNSGEAFIDGGRLMDWSYAGYHAGERTIPDVPEVANVMDYGAVADGETDDFEAFDQAISAAEDVGGGAVVVPPGRYLVGQQIELSSGVVLRGAGRDDTTLYFPNPLGDLYDGNFSFGGGLISAESSRSFPELTRVTSGSSRGDYQLQVASTEGIEAGDWVFLRQTDVDGTLIRRLHDDQVDGGTDNVGAQALHFPSRVTAVGDHTITLERALIVDIETRWDPTLFAVEPSLTEVGVEYLTIAFPATFYRGHFNEEGYNGIYFRSAWHSWVRDVTVRNADFGINFRQSFFCTATGVHLTTDGVRNFSESGHHGINNSHGGDNLYKDFDIQTTFIHDLTNEWYAHGVVFSGGRGDDLAMDHHRGAPYYTLWTDLDLGAGNRPWASGGRSDRGPHTAAHDTVWNVHANRDIALPDADYGPSMTFVGVDTDEAIPTDAPDWHLEDVSAEAVEPQNLWQAMVARRLPDGPADPGGADPADTGIAADTGNSSDTGIRSDTGSTSDVGVSDATSSDVGPGPTADTGLADGSTADSSDIGAGPPDASDAPGPADNSGCSAANPAANPGWAGLFWASIVGVALFRRRD